jgi:hypothetical protein
MTAMSMQPGDSLWTIAQRFYGSGEREARRFVANDGRVQPHEWALTHHGVIYPGWIVRLPEAARVVRFEGGAEKTTRACERKLVIHSLALPASQSRRTPGQ